MQFLSAFGGLFSWGFLPPRSGGWQAGGEAACLPLSLF